MKTSEPYTTKPLGDAVDASVAPSCKSPPRSMRLAGAELIDIPIDRPGTGSKTALFDLAALPGVYDDFGLAAP